jgi:hypothetical protein
VFALQHFLFESPVEAFQVAGALGHAASSSRRALASKAMRSM